MLTRPAGHEAKAEARKSEDEAEARNFFEAEATMYEAGPDTLENNPVCMSMKTKIIIGVQNIDFSKQPIHNRNDCRWLYCEY